MEHDFFKYHSFGNAILILDLVDHPIHNLKALSSSLLDNERGIGADQLLALTSKTEGVYQVAGFNKDSSPVGMCVNGSRCMAAYIRKYKDDMNVSIAMQLDGTPVSAYFDEGVSASNGEEGGSHIPAENKEQSRSGFDHETDISIGGGYIRVSLGSYSFQASDIPLAQDTPLRESDMSIGDRVFRVTTVSVGNPHCVCFLEDIESFPLEHYGPLIEHSPLFPERVSFEIVERKSSSHLKIRIWERGSGATQACGSGSCAVAVVANTLGLCGTEVLVENPGGTGKVLINNKERTVSISGQAHQICSGQFDSERISSLEVVPSCQNR